MEFPDRRPSPEELLADDRGLVRLSGFLILRRVDRARSEVRDGHCYIRLYFNH